MLKVGDVLDCFCGGVFGDDNYSGKAVEAIGPDWVVVRESDGGVLFFKGHPSLLEEYVQA